MKSPKPEPSNESQASERRPEELGSTSDETPHLPIEPNPYGVAALSCCAGAFACIVVTHMTGPGDKPAAKTVLLALALCLSAGAVPLMVTGFCSRRTRDAEREPLTTFLSFWGAIGCFLYTFNHFAGILK